MKRKKIIKKLEKLGFEVGAVNKGPLQIFFKGSPYLDTAITIDEIKANLKEQ